MEYKSLDFASSSPLVLIADDDKDTRELLSVMLKREGFRTEHAYDGTMAVERTRALLPELVLLDIQMPGIDGFEVLRQLREHKQTERIPIVVISAAAREPRDVVKGLGLGADDYMLKPFTVAELIARVFSKIRARRLEDNLIKRSEQLEALVRIGTELNQGLSLDEMAQRLLNKTAEHFRAHQAILLLLNKEKLTPISYYGFGDARPDGLAAGTLGDFVRTSDEAVVIADATDDQRVKKIFEGSSCVAGLATPIKHQGELRGALLLGHASPRHFIEDDVQVLRSIAEQSALAIRNAQLYAQLEAYAHGLESMVEARTQALQAAQQQLIRAEKLAALGTLAAGVAHEVNNPLQPILSSLEMALEDIDSKRPVERELLEYAMSDVQRIKRIVSNLLDFARPAQATPSAVDVNTIMNEVLALANKQLKVAGIKLNTAFGQVRKVRGSADQLKQVFLNLVVNAMDAMADMGRKGELNVGTREEGDSVVVTVADNGIGIPKDRLHQVFDPFFTTKANGTGLGLSVSHSIVQGHGGEITVESAVSTGSVFTIRLPASKEDAVTEPDSTPKTKSVEVKAVPDKPSKQGKKT